MYKDSYNYVLTQHEQGIEIYQHGRGSIVQNLIHALADVSVKLHINGSLESECINNHSRYLYTCTGMYVYGTIRGLKFDQY